MNFKDKHIIVLVYGCDVRSYKNRHEKQKKTEECNEFSLSKQKSLSSVISSFVFQSRAPTSSASESVSYQQTDAIRRTGRRRRLLHGHCRRVY